MLHLLSTISNGQAVLQVFGTCKGDRDRANGRATAMSLIAGSLIGLLPCISTKRLQDYGTSMNCVFRCIG